MEMMENESLIYKGFLGTEANFHYFFVKSSFVCEASSPSMCTVKQNILNMYVRSEKISNIKYQDVLY